MDAGELQQVARLVDINRQRITRIEEQVIRLDSIFIEQEGVIRAMKAIPDDGRRVMIPLGSGVQLPVSPTSDGVIIDIGSGIQAERPLPEAIEILEARRGEVAEVLTQLRQELSDAEEVVKTLAATFAEGAQALQPAGPLPQESQQEPQEKPKKPEDPQTVKPTKTKRRRRRPGSELTLDD